MDLFFVQWSDGRVLYDGTAPIVFLDRKAAENHATLYLDEQQNHPNVVEISTMEMLQFARQMENP